MSEKQKYITGFLFGVGVALGYYLSGVQSSDIGSGNEAETEEQNIVRENDEDVVRAEYTDLGVAFSYRKNPDGYVIEMLPQREDDANFIRGYSLTDIYAYEELQRSNVGRDGPPTISIRVFRNTKKQTARAWVEENTMVTNFSLRRGDVSLTAIDGVDALRYEADGLYISDNIVVSNNQFMYSITGTYAEENSLIREDFEPFLNSIEFIRTNE